MKSSWNFSTAILEIWVLVLTKPGWANETPTTSLRVPHEYSEYYYNQNQHNGENHHEEHHHHHHHHHPPYNRHYSIPGGQDFDRDSLIIRNHHQSYVHPEHSHSSYYTKRHNNHFRSSHHRSNLFNSQSDSSVEVQALASSSLHIPEYSTSPHRCYVCLPPNKNSREAQQILAIFANELRPLIPDCSQFNPYVDAGRFEFDCPPMFGGCLLRIHGANISRACSKYRVNDCKKANHVEFCYCTTPLCNDKKPEPPVTPAVVHHHQGKNPGAKGATGRNGKSSPVLRGPAVAIQLEGSFSPQGVRSGVSVDHDEDPVNLPMGVNDDDDDINGGSGTGTSENDHGEHSHHRTFIDPFTTMEPNLFQEENGYPVAVEDPNPHTKIGISMTASTSGSSKLGISWTHSFPVKGSLIRGGSSASTAFHLFLHLFIRLFGESGVEEKASEKQHFPLCTLPQQPSSMIEFHSPHVFSNLTSGYVETSNHLESREDANKHPTSILESLSFYFLNSQLCFIASLLLLLKLLLS